MSDQKLNRGDIVGVKITQLGEDNWLEDWVIMNAEHTRAGYMPAGVFVGYDATGRAMLQQSSDPSDIIKISPYMIGLNYVD